MHYETRLWKNATAVLIQFGPFTGFKGVVVSAKLQRVTVSLILQRRHSVLVELDVDMIKRYDDSDTFDPTTMNTAGGAAQTKWKARRTHKAPGV
jgi:hypothetical protein